MPSLLRSSGFHQPLRDSARVFPLQLQGVAHTRCGDDGGAKPVVVGDGDVQPFDERLLDIDEVRRRSVGRAVELER